MRRASSIILLLGFLALGSGLLEYLHLQTHVLDHTRAMRTQENGTHNGPSANGDCWTCVQLHLPAVSAGGVPLLICLGLLVAFLTLLAPRPTPRRIAARIDCRGPPVL